MLFDDKGTYIHNLLIFIFAVRKDFGKWHNVKSITLLLMPLELLVAYCQFFMK